MCHYDNRDFEKYSIPARVSTCRYYGADKVIFDEVHYINDPDRVGLGKSA